MHTYINISKYIHNVKQIREVYCCGRISVLLYKYLLDHIQISCYTISAIFAIQISCYTIQ